ncbi:UNVERIFIED_CONTAM: hypothetical protein BEN50_05015 [Euhalothece sp. KZN 001]
MNHQRKITIALDFNQGSLKEGFSQVTIQIFHQTQVERDTIALAPFPDLEEAYQKWQLLYCLLNAGGRNSAEIEFDWGTPTNVSEMELVELGEILQAKLNQWFIPLERKLRRLTPQDELRLTLAVDDFTVRQLPWHLLSFFEDYPQAELALTGSKWKQFPHSKTPAGKVRILAVMGGSQGLDLEKDEELLNATPGLDLVLLEKPTRRQLNEYLWDEKGWDIWFFAGHSYPTQTSGCIQINSEESLTIGQLKQALKAAISRGLQIAIFNSCNGLALTKELENLHLPYAIVMREPILDPVAQGFLKYFLQAFARERKSFYQSVREGREQLQGMESEFPGASYLPVIFQNLAPTITPPSWKQLMNRGSQPWERPLAVSGAIALLIIALRAFGLFVGAELAAYDRFLRWRFNESTDSRLLLVRGENEAKYGFPVSDQVLVGVIEKLEDYQPRVMGLDLFRYTERPPGRDRLEKILAENPRLIGICVQDDQAPTGNPPIAEMPSHRIGFVNIHYDPDEVLRRISLFQTPSVNDSCATDSYLGWQLAYRYLLAEGIEPKVLPDNRVKIHRATLKELPSYTGAYGKKGKWGFEILLNYRAGKTPFQSVTFEQVLNDDFDPDWIQDKVVIIGMALPNDPNDRHLTPYSPDREKMPGMTIIAHTTSQLLNAALEGRSLVWILPFWGECLWILGWSIVGGISAWCCRRFLWWALITGTQGVLLSVLCWLFLLAGGWLPVIPSLFALTVTSTGIFFYRFRR